MLTCWFSGSLGSQSILHLFSDQDLRNIIDKLAQFVARNGPEFEKMTKNKQKNNPKFSFLYGGEYFNYYQYKVTTEQASKHTLKCQRLNVSGRPRSLVARNYNRFKWTSAVYSSKAIGRCCSRSRRGLYGTEQAICNAPTGRRDARAARAGGVDGGGARAAAVARRQLRAHRPACSSQPWPRQHQCSDQHAQRANHSIWEQSQCSTHCEYLHFLNCLTLHNGFPTQLVHIFCYWGT